jgi:hypothetical protein
VHVSDWLTITQDRINAFAARHRRSAMDPRGSGARESGIALRQHHRAWLSHAVAADPAARHGQHGRSRSSPGAKSVVNYGLNKLRFPNAVKVGAKIRGRFSLVSVEVIAPNALQITETLHRRDRRPGEARLRRRERDSRQLLASSVGRVWVNPSAALSRGSS